MDWIKHYGNAGLDPRMLALKKALGYFGIGIYWTMVERIECWGEGVYPRQQLLDELGGRQANRFRLRQVLDDFDLFVTLESGMVVLQKEQHTPQHTPQHPSPLEDKNDEESAVRSEAQRACVYIDREKDYSNTTTRTSPHDHYAAELKAEQGEWREMVCMKSGYGALLLKHWEEAVEQWRQHVICYDTSYQIDNYSRARYYFNSFIKPRSKTGEALRATLEALDAKAVHTAAATVLLPPDAPTRPSERAVWNPAKEEWSEFY